MPDALGLPVLVIPLGAVPLIRGDEPWIKYAVLWWDSARTAPYDLTGKTVQAEIRWVGGSRVLIAEVVDAGVGLVKLFLVGTTPPPLGRLSYLFISVDNITWAAVPVDVEQGINLFPILLDAVSIVQGVAWENFAVFWADVAGVVPYDLTGHTVAVEIRWLGETQAVTAVVTDADIGFVMLSLTAEQTALLPIGRSALFVMVDDSTVGAAFVSVEEGD